MATHKTTSYSWEIVDSYTAVKICDKKFFEYDNIAIPRNTLYFWEIEGLNPSEKKSVSIRYDEKLYNCYFYMDPLNRIRIYWHIDLQKEIIKYQSACNLAYAVFKKLNNSLYNLSMVIGADAEPYKKHNSWILPCNRQKYNCNEAFKELICVDWHQSKQLSNIEVNDIVFIYSSTPIKSITHQCIVNKINIPTLEIPDDKYYLDKNILSNKGPFVELQCVREFDLLDGLKFEELKKHGIKSNIQGPLKVVPELENHLNDMISLQNTTDRVCGGNEQYISKMHTRQINSQPDETIAPLLSDELLKEMAQKKQTIKVKSKTVTVAQKERNPYIEEYAKRKANGVCQLCGNPAPFNSLSGKPYLESHHIIWLSNGGSDTIDNTVALCPNCHRKMHILNLDEDISFLKTKVTENK